MLNLLIDGHSGAQESFRSAANVTARPPVTKGSMKIVCVSPCSNVVMVAAYPGLQIALDSKCLNT
jgi:hypothetical protein